MKTCTACKLVKAEEAFGKDKTRPDGKSVRCKACRVADAREYRRKYPERVKAIRVESEAKRRVFYAANREQMRARNRDYRFRSVYGITHAEYDQMLAAQGGVCAICAKPSPDTRRLHVDHEHQSGRIRGLLCVRCNQGVGQFCDSPALLLRAANYLEAV